MARIFGRRGSLVALGILGLIALAPLAVYSPILALVALAALAVLATGLAHRRATALAARCDKLSAEIDVVSKRLLRIEGAAKAGQFQHPAPGADAAALAAGVEEVTVEIGLLSSIVRDLAAVVATQDSEIAQLKTVAEAPPVAVEPVLPPPPVVAPPAPSAPPQRSAVVPSGAPKPLVMTPRSMPPVRRGPEPFLGAVIEVPPLEDQEQAREAALIAAFDADGLEVHLQPVVTLPQRKVAAYEALARLRVAGEVLAPEVFLPVLERHGRTTDLDRRMLQRVATIARHLAGRGSEAAVGYGLSPLSLYEPGFLRSLARLVASEPGLAGRLVVALPQASWRNLDAEQIGALAAMRGKIGFILDRPTDLRFDALSLAERGVAQVKVSADLLLRQASARQNLSDIAVEDLVAALARAGIRLVATAVERETDVPDLIDLDVPFAQGSVFAAPRAVRADVLAAATPAQAAPAAAAPPAPEEPEPPPQRRPFRDFLRRAS